MFMRIVTLKVEEMQKRKEKNNVKAKQDEYKRTELEKRYLDDE
jgi:hypothetical protein